MCVCMCVCVCVCVFACVHAHACVGGGGLIYVPENLLIKISKGFGMYDQTMKVCKAKSREDLK